MCGYPLVMVSGYQNDALAFYLIYPWKEYVAEPSSLRIWIIIHFSREYIPAYYCQISFGHLRKMAVQVGDGRY